MRIAMFVTMFAVGQFTLPMLCDAAPPEPANGDAAKWQILFDGKTLNGWEKLAKGSFENSGDIQVNDAVMLLAAGDSATGARYKGKFPKQNFELSLEAKRVAGEDFFCGLTFPVDDGSLTLIMGGWGGWVVGLSCIDGNYAIDTDTVQAIRFKNDQWYQVRVRVTKTAVFVWVDNEQIIDLPSAEHKLSASEEMLPCRPLGVATWKTTGAIRKIRFRHFSDQQN